MAHRRDLCAIVLAACSLFFSLSLEAQSGDSVAMQQILSARYKLTTTTADRTDIVTAGDVVEIRKPGLLMYSVESPMPPSNTFKGGKITQGWGGFGKDMLITMASSESATAANYPHRPFVAGEKRWVTAVTVQNDGVVFQLYSDPYNGIRYYANLKVSFPDKITVQPVDAFVQAIAEVVTAENANQAASSTLSAPVSSSGLDNIAPPPPPTDAPPPTNDQVTTPLSLIASTIRSCRNCHQPLDASSPFCGECGTRVG
jgi:hypothetical protein